MMNERALARLRSWIDGLLTPAPHPTADETPEEINCAAVLAIVRHHLPAGMSHRMLVDGDLDVMIHAPIETLAETILAHVMNALDVHHEERIVVVVDASSVVARFTIGDHTIAMPTARSSTARC